MLYELFVQAIKILPLFKGSRRQARRRQQADGSIPQRSEDSETSDKRSASVSVGGSRMTD
jgi:hypothetical protein